MSKLNRFQFIGNIGADAEVRTINDNQRAVISFNVAITEKWRTAQGADQEKTTWVRCSIWRKPDQTTIAQYLKKGQMVYVEGRPEARAYKDANGEAKGSLEVTVDNIELLGSRQGQAQGGGGQANAPRPTPTFGGGAIENTPAPTFGKPAAEPRFSQTPTAQQDDDLPF